MSIPRRSVAPRSDNGAAMSSGRRSTAPLPTDTREVKASRRSSEPAVCRARRCAGFCEERETTSFAPRKLARSLGRSAPGGVEWWLPQRRRVVASFESRRFRWQPVGRDRMDDAEARSGFILDASMRRQYHGAVVTHGGAPADVRTRCPLGRSAPHQGCSGDGVPQSGGGPHHSRQVQDHGRLRKVR